MGNSVSTDTKPTGPTGTFRDIFDDALKGLKQGHAFGGDEPRNRSRTPQRVVQRGRTTGGRTTERKPVSTDVYGNLKLAETKRNSSVARVPKHTPVCDNTSDKWIWFTSQLTSAMTKCYPGNLLAPGCGTVMLHIIIVALMSLSAANAVDSNQNVALGLTATALIVVDGAMTMNGATLESFRRLNIVYMLGLVIFFAWFNGFASMITTKFFKPQPKPQQDPPTDAIYVNGANIESYIRQITGSASVREMFGHNSSFVLSTMCTEIVASVDHQLHQCSLFTNTTSVMRNAMQESWSEIGFYLFSIMSKQQVLLGISEIQVRSDVFTGKGITIRDFRINNQISAETLIISTTNLDKAARLLWLFRYMYAVYGVEGKRVPTPTSQLASGDPVNTMGSILRCFDANYDNDNDATALLYGTMPESRRVKTHTEDVRDIQSHMKKYVDVIETRDPKNDNKRLLNKT